LWRRFVHRNRGAPTPSQIDIGRLLLHQPFPPPAPKTPVKQTDGRSELIYKIVEHFDYIYIYTHFFFDCLICERVQKKTYVYVASDFHKATSLTMCDKLLKPHKNLNFK